MSRHDAYDDDNFKTITDLDGKPTRVLKDRGRVRISMSMRDSVSLRDAKPQFTDGRTTDPTALNRPGYRIPVVQDRRAVHDAYEAYEADLTNAYLGDDHADPAITDSKIQDCYAAYDHELTEAWRAK